MSDIKMISLPIDEYQKLDAIRDERDRLEAELEAMRALAIHHDARAQRLGKEADHYKALVEAAEKVIIECEVCDCCMKGNDFSEAHKNWSEAAGR